MKTRLVFSAVLLPLLCAGSLRAQGWPQTWDTPCTMDVVLVTFRDTTGARTGVPYNYHLYDRPYGTNLGQSADSMYTLEDFQRLLTGSAFVGTSQTVGTDHPLPEVFGSVRAYLDAVSSGAFELRVRMINPADDQGYPRWVELPEIKGHYAEIDINSADDDAFWDDAYDTAIDSVRCWNPDLTDPPGVDCRDSEVSGYAITDIGPDNTVAERLRHKVLYLYSGAVSDRDALLRAAVSYTDAEGDDKQAQNIFLLS